LVVFLRNLQVIHGEAGNRQRDPQSGRADLLDIVRRITIRRRLRGPLEHLLKVVES